MVSDPLSGRGVSPSVAVDDAGGVHIVWQGQPLAVADILYRRGGLTFTPGPGGVLRR